MPRVWKQPAEYIATTIAWSDVLLKLRHPCKVPGCDWISFESIQECLDKGNIEDCTAPQCPTSHHAARIAHLVQKLRAGEALTPIHIHCSPKRCSIWDGSHRLRAYQFEGKLDNIPVIITGELAKCLDFVAKPFLEQLEILSVKQGRKTHQVKFRCICGNLPFMPHRDAVKHKKQHNDY